MPGWIDLPPDQDASVMKYSTHLRGSASMRFTSHRRQQRGVTLIELMVGITIGLLVSVAAIGTLVYNRVASTTITDTVNLQQDAAAVMRMIGRQLKQAGAVPAEDYVDLTNPGLSTQKFVYRSDYIGLDNTQPIPISIRGTNNGVEDTLTVSFSNVANITALLSDCMGNNPAAASAVVTSQFSLDDGSILCQGAAAGATPQPVIPNVEELQIWYAVRDPAVVPPVIRYFQADAVADWTAVEAVQVCIRLVGVSGNNPTGGAATADCTGGAVADDGRIRRVFRQVFTLRNLQTLS